MWQNCLLAWCSSRTILSYNPSNLSYTLKSYCILYGLHITVVELLNNVAIALWIYSCISCTNSVYTSSPASQNVLSSTFPV